MKKNKFLIIWEFLIVIIIISIFGMTIITALEVLGFVTIPEQYSLTRFLKTSSEITTTEYSNIIKDYSDIDIEPTASDADWNYTVEMPEEIQNIYNEPNKQENGNFVNKKYYYSQLDEYGKIIYDKMYSNIEKLKTGTFIVRYNTEFNDLLQREDGAKILENAFQSSLNALIYDNPEIFYLDITKMYLYTETTTIVVKKTYKIFIGPEDGQNYYAEGFNSKEDVDLAINQVQEKANQIISNLSGTDYNKIRTIHDYLIDNIQYDQTISMPNIYNMYGALVNGVTVCEGYAKAFKYILDNIGMECIFVCGTGINSNSDSESHAWNYVKLSDEWYAVDVTWDDPIIVGGGMLTNSHRYKYLLKGSNEFRKDHIEDGNIIEGVQFYYPALNVNNY